MLGRSSVLLVLVALLGSGTAHAAPKAKGKPAATKPAKPGAKPKKGKEAEKEKPAETEAEKAAEQEKPDDAESASKEENVKAAGTSAAKATDAASVKVKEDKEGVKTYKFETVDVEGRLKSPQVIYFLRRVRAEFDAGALGHRSFLGELSDSRRSAAFR
ncbi:MAG: hypothetical protein K0R38_5512 [Polyangiaceae bacterium]|jgi:hypothetical protein|nr:hypothetical protein [Polyangiaceae bacterium]